MKRETEQANADSFSPSPWRGEGRGGGERRYELLIFDWDGTLADSAGAIVSRMQEAIAALGLPARSDRQIAELIGLGLDDALARLFPELEPAHAASLIADYGRRYRELPPDRLFKGVIETLTQLQTAGYQLAVATGKSRRGLARALEQTGLHAYFCASRCADETAAKPDPCMLNELLLATATEPEQALMIGDTEYDMAMARAAGIPALGVACGVHDTGRLRTAGAVEVIADIMQVPIWLDKHA